MICGLLEAWNPPGMDQSKYSYRDVPAGLSKAEASELIDRLQDRSQRLKEA